MRFITIMVIGTLMLALASCSNTNLTKGQQGQDDKGRMKYDTAKLPKYHFTRLQETQPPPGIKSNRPHRFQNLDGRFIL